MVCPSVVSTQVVPPKNDSNEAKSNPGSRLGSFTQLVAVGWKALGFMDTHEAIKTSSNRYLIFFIKCDGFGFVFYGSKFALIMAITKFFF